MKKKLLLMLIITVGVLSLFSCGAKDDAPDGLQTANVCTESGYIFYAPENWAVINSESISAAKVSAINNTSITFAEAAVPVGTLPEYFDESIKLLSPEAFTEFNLVLRDEKCNFGNADGECLKYVYTYKYEEYNFACMQILVNHNDRFFIFTYTSYGDVNNESSYYRNYLDAVQLAIDNFTFTEPQESNAPVNYPKDADGYIMVSEEEIASFELYLPEEYTVLYSGAYVKAKISDSANISLSKATQTGIDIVDYLELRKDNLSKLTDGFTDVSIAFTREIPEESEIMKNWSFDVTPNCNTSLVFGDLDPSNVVEYEYTYTFNGQAYHVYQMLGIGNLSGYVFTYTSLESDYAEHLDEIKTILQKVKF